jgi:hypothetical protein
MKMKNVWRKLFKRNRPLTNQHGPAKKVSLVKDSISRDDKGRWILEKTETSIDKFIAELTQELVDEGNRIHNNPVPKPKKQTIQLNEDKAYDHNCGKKQCLCKTTKKTAPIKPATKKPPVSGTKAVSKAKAVKPTPAKPTPKKPKSK